MSDEPPVRLPDLGARPTGPSAQPPIDRLPGDDARPDVLAEFVRSGTRPWGGDPVPLSSTVVGALWTVLVLNLGFGAWLLAVRAGVASCSGPLCWAATLGDHPVLTLTLSEVGAGALAVSVPLTRGLSRAGGPQLALIVVGTLAGLVALAGLMAALAATAIVLAAAFGVVAVMAERL